MLPIGDGSGAEVAAHEFLHSLGATPPQAPHVCEEGHVCDAAISTHGCDARANVVDFRPSSISTRTSTSVISSWSPANSMR